MKRLPSILLLTVACILVYFAVPSFDFQRDWDDQNMFGNIRIDEGFTCDNLQTIFTQYYLSQYGPIHEMIYLALYEMVGYNPMVFHVYLLLLHIICTCLLLVFVESLLKGLATTGTARWVAFVTALLFAVHPLQVESIAWISASKIPLYTIVMLLSMTLYLRYIRTQRIGAYLSVLLLSIFAFFCKEQSVVMPALLLLLDWLLGRTPLSPPKLQVKPSETCTWTYLLIEKMPFIIFSAFGIFLTYTNQSQDVANDWAGYPFGQRVVFCCYSIVEYLGKLAAPINLLYIYPFPMAPGLPLPGRFFIYPLIVIGGVGLLLFWLRDGNWRRQWPIVFGLLFFLVNMSIVLHIVPMTRFVVIADRYVYFGSIGFFFVIAWYAVPWLQKMVAAGRKWALVLPVVYLLYLGGYAHYRSYAWKDSKTLTKELNELIHPAPEQNNNDKRYNNFQNL